jgi:hypothetical protein
MFNCRNCGKAYESRKRYIEHIEVCEEDIQSLLSRPSVQSDLSRKSRPASSVATPTSRQRSSEGSIRQDGKLRRAVADLMDERTRLKGELGKCETDLRARVHAHREDITSTQEYYQGQVISLMSERDELADQLKKRDDIIRNREKTRSEMVNKLASQQKKMESYEESNTEQLSGLKIEITNLRNRLAEQIDEQERKCTAFVKQITDQECTYHQQITQITEHLKTANQALITESEKMRQLVESKNAQEIASQRILAEKNDTMVAEQNRGVRETAAFEERIVKEREISKTSMNQVRSELVEQIRERDVSIRDMLSAHEKDVARMVDKLESVEVDSKKVIFQAHAKNLAETQEQLLKLEMSNASLLESNYSMATRKIEESKEEVARFRKKLLNTDKIREDAVAKKERDVRLEQTSRVDELNKSILCHQEEAIHTKLKTNTVVEHLKTENSSMFNSMKEREIIIENLKRELENQRLQYEATARTKVTETNTVVEHLKTENRNTTKSMKERELIIENLKRELENQYVKYEATTRAKVTETNTVVEHLKTENRNTIKSMKERELIIENLKRELENQRLQYEATARAKVTETNTFTEHLNTENRNTIKITKDRELIIENLKREFENQRLQYEATTRAKVTETNTFKKDRELIIENLKREFENQRLQYEATSRAKVTETNTFMEHLKTENRNTIKITKDRELIIENLKRELENQRFQYEATAHVKLLENNTTTEHLKTENRNSTKDRELIIENLKREFENQRLQYEATARAKVTETNTFTEHLKTESRNTIKITKELELIIENLKRELENQYVQYEATTRAKLLENNTTTEHLKTENSNMTKSIKDQELIIENLKREFENQRMHYESTAHAKLLENNTVMEHLKIENSKMTKAVKDSGIELTRMASETTRLRSQFITNLNIQQTDLENAVKERELIIDNLRSEFKNQHMECETKIALANSITRTHVDSESREVARRDAELECITVNLNTVIGDLEREQKAHALLRTSSQDTMKQKVTQISSDAAMNLNTLQYKLNTAIAEHDIVVKNQQVKISLLHEAIQNDKDAHVHNEAEHDIVVKNQQAEISLLHEAIQNDNAVYKAQHDIVVKNQQAEISLLHEAIQNNNAMYKAQHDIVVKNQKAEISLLHEAIQNDNAVYKAQHDIVVKNQKEEISLLHEAIQNNKAAYIHNETKWKNSDNEALKKFQTESEKKIQGMTSIIDRQEKDLSVVRNDFKDKMNDQATTYKAKYIELKRESDDKLARKEGEVSQLHRDQDTLLDEQASLYECRIAHKEDEFTEKTATLNARVAEIKATSSDSKVKIKKIREDCIEKLKKGFVEIEQLNANNSKLNEYLQITKNSLDSKDTEIQYINETHDKLKNSFLTNINKQKCAMDQTLKVRDALIADRDAKISKLEDLLSKKKDIIN